MIGGTLQMDLSYVFIPNSNNEMVTLYRARFMKYFFENPKDPCNEDLHEAISHLFISNNHFMTF